MSDYGDSDEAEIARILATFEAGHSVTDQEMKKLLDAMVALGMAERTGTSPTGEPLYRMKREN